MWTVGDNLMAPHFQVCRRFCKHITSLISMENNDGLSFETGGN